MEKVPLISVVIPCYNDGIYLPETLAHLHKQTLQNFEVIIVNDGSTDTTTLNILKQVETGNVRVLHKENGRMSSARNHGVAHAKGTFIAALDADDYFEHTFFEKAIDILNRKENIAVVTSYIQLFGTINKLSRPRGGGENNFLFSSQCPACAMVRKSVWNDVGGYDENMRYGYEDWEFYIRVTQKGLTVHVIPEKLLFYRQTAKSTHKNDTLTHRTELIQYIVDKHKDWYLRKITELITNEEVIYRNSRVSYQVISELLKNRITGKYKAKR
jgi:glycosyltransferase involved in cell wall biosynthesis